MIRKHPREPSGQVDLINICARAIHRGNTSRLAHRSNDQTRRWSKGTLRSYPNPPSAFDKRRWFKVKPAGTGIDRRKVPVHGTRTLFIAHQRDDEDDGKGARLKFFDQRVDRISIISHPIRERMHRGGIVKERQDDSRSGYNRAIERKAPASVLAWKLGAMKFEFQ